jgi:hypothetical protein
MENLYEIFANVIKIVITSSRRRPGSSDFKAFLDSGSSTLRSIATAEDGSTE